MPKIVIVVAAAEDNAIGKNNDLLWHLPEDWKHFKKVTSGKTVIMGRKTFNSLPGGPLKNRKNIVVTANTNINFEGCTMARSIDEALQLTSNEDEVHVLGGSNIYRQFLPFTDEIYLTRVHAKFPEADTFFPDFNLDEWITEWEESFSPDEKHKYPFTILKLVRKHA